MTADDLKKLRDLANGATPGPWFHAYAAVCDRPRTDEYMRLERTIPDDAPDEAYDILPDATVCHVPVVAGDTPTAQGARDAEFISAARTAVPALLDEIDRRQGGRFPRPVVCAWCGNHHRSVIDEVPTTQGDGCAASVYQLTEEVLGRVRTAVQSLRLAPNLEAFKRIAGLPIGTWLAQGHYGSSNYDCEVFRFVQNAPTAAADPVCDNCIGERVVAGDLEQIEGHFP